MGVPNTDSMRAPHSGFSGSQLSVTQAARGLREKFGDSTKSFVAQGNLIISRLRASRPDALSAPQGKKLLTYVNEGQKALDCLPLLEAGEMQQEGNALASLEATMQKISEARVALLHATRKRTRAAAIRSHSATSDTGAFSDGESRSAAPAPKRRRRPHSYAGHDGSWLAAAAANGDETPLTQGLDLSLRAGSIPLVARLRAAGVKVPPEFVCALTNDVMRDPVLLTGDGRHYESSACARWLVSHNTSPTTHAQLPACNFMARAHALKQRIWAFLDEHSDILRESQSERAPTYSTTKAAAASALVALAASQ
ncbi:hypothetical protein JKP88DRAFT_302767 [Tribonema minus]|uniref:U-box domain-containing protein n=1 Tax=Tribonema minus TaxID=303371 RepID=A0A835Z8R9_9STRA|nr:hypothetical protein JKP88DRAFT_302767 [Tribonema minus]